MRNSQIVRQWIGDTAESLRLPPPTARLSNGVLWGRHDCLFTPAYWAAQAWLHKPSLGLMTKPIGSTLAEEIAVCLLGGHGISAEVGIAAFMQLRKNGLLQGDPVDAKQFEAALREPIRLEGRSIRYRFPKQRSAALADAMARLPDVACAANTSGTNFRKALLAVRGIGFKTASWIVRNWTGSDEVAILDVHILRAGVLTGFFAPTYNVTRDYLRLEQQFLDFASAIEVRPSLLDHLMWGQMREAGALAHTFVTKILQRHRATTMLRAA